MGTQSFYLSESKVIPLVMKGGLMTFENREPIKQDYDILDVVEITGSNRWKPRRFYDDSEALPSVSDSIVQGFHITGSMNQEPTTVKEDTDDFYDAQQDDTMHYWYSSDSFSTKVLKTTVEDTDL